MIRVSLDQSEFGFPAFRRFPHSIRSIVVRSRQYRFHANFFCLSFLNYKTNLNSTLSNLDSTVNDMDNCKNVEPAGNMKSSFIALYVDKEWNNAQEEYVLVDFLK
jgi:hypothetical protein